MNRMSRPVIDTMSRPVIDTMSTLVVNIWLSCSCKDKVADAW